MITVVQRVKKSSVTVNNEVVSKINNGILALIGFSSTDEDKDLEFILNKIINLRIFSDEKEKMNYSLLDIKGDLLLVPQFTLYGNCLKGRRPDFTKSASLEKGLDLFEKFKIKCEKIDLNIKFGIFQADMKVDLINDGPVTLIIDSELKTKNGR